MQRKDVDAGLDMLVDAAHPHPVLGKIETESSEEIKKHIAQREQVRFSYLSYLAFNHMQYSMLLSR